MKKFKRITIECRDDEGNLELLLQQVKKRGNCGHSFSIEIDMKNPPKFLDGEIMGRVVDWDGDGADWIGDITVEDINDPRRKDTP